MVWVRCCWARFLAGAGADGEHADDAADAEDDAEDSEESARLLGAQVGDDASHMAVSSQCTSRRLSPAPIPVGQGMGVIAAWFPSGMWT
jgi:hypothetical protein